MKLKNEEEISCFWPKNYHFGPENPEITPFFAQIGQFWEKKGENVAPKWQSEQQNDRIWTYNSTMRK